MIEAHTTGRSLGRSGVFLLQKAMMWMTFPHHDGIMAYLWQHCLLWWNLLHSICAHRGRVCWRVVCHEKSHQSRYPISVCQIVAHQPQHLKTISIGLHDIGRFAHYWTFGRGILQCLLDSPWCYFGVSLNHHQQEYDAGWDITLVSALKDPG